MTEAREWSFGNHQVRFEPPDVAVAHLRGEVTEEDARRLMEIAREVASAQPAYFVVNMQPLEGFPFPRLSAGARKHLVDHNSSDWYRALLYVGGGLMQKITLKGLSMALLLTGRQRFETVFVDSVEEARARIVAHRERESALRPHG